MQKGKPDKLHIGIFGRRNSGKSSLINAMSEQDIAIVSDIAGTTTDPVKKSVELRGIGSTIIIDTAGIDDTGQLGDLRVKKSIKAIKEIDFAIIVITNNTYGSYEQDIINELKSLKVRWIIIHNKEDIENIDPKIKEQVFNDTGLAVIPFSAKFPENYKQSLLGELKINVPNTYSSSLIGDLVSYGDIVVLITPIDIEAPKGRMILPQVQVIRDILDNDCISIVLKEREVDAFLKRTNIKPKLAITDSQVFLKADASIPNDIPLTSFSILLARNKGNFENYVKGTYHISKLKNHDKVLLLESCTHQVSCDDIGRVKIPRWITGFTGKKLIFETVAGLDAPSLDIQDYSLVIQCGGCMITQKQLQNRLKSAIDSEIPVTNYGMAIAYVQGIFQRAVAPFGIVPESNVGLL